MYPMIRNFAEAHQALHEFYGSTGIERHYKLDRMRALMAHLGNPQETLRVIHVAGTSGKTSTSYYAAALLKASGAKVGLTLSPHVDEVNERLQIDLIPLPEAEFCRALDEYIQLVHQSDIRPSYFELMVAFAFWEFARRKVDYAVIEVGLGGLLDGTNIVRRADKVCIITDIGFDHMNILGNTIPEIAFQKAGIIQPGNHVFVYDQGSEVTEVMQDRVRQQKAHLHLITPGSLSTSHFSELPLFQQRNLYLALQAVEYVLTRDGHEGLSNEQLQDAIATQIPARMELFYLDNKTLIVDGSHNAQKIGALLESVHARFPGQEIAALVSFADGQDARWQGAVDVLEKTVHSIIITSFTAEQDVPKIAVDPDRIVAYLHEHHFTDVSVELQPEAGLQQLLRQPQKVLVVAGSFYLLNHIRPLLKR